MTTKNYNPFDALQNDLQSIKFELADIRQVLTSTTQPEKKYYTISEAAKKLNVAEITIYRNAQAGKIPTKKIGSRLMVPGSYVDGK